MDEKAKTADWSWLPVHMPGVRRLMQDKRAELGNGHVNECWQRGVVKAEPGWFFAREGALAVGVPWPGMPDFEGKQITATQAMLVLRDKPAAAGRADA